MSMLPIFPSGGNGCSLSELFLPGGFIDPLGLADLLDIECLDDELIRFAKELGARELSFDDYCTELLPGVFERGLEPPGVRRLVDLLVKNRQRIESNRAVLSALATLPLVECSNGPSRLVAAHTAYFESEPVRGLFGISHPLVDPQDIGYRRLYEILGVASAPRLPDVIGLVDRCASANYDRTSVEVTQKVVAHLGECWISLPPDDRESLRRLRDLEWLPREGAERWFEPGDLDAVFVRHLCERTGAFLDCPHPTQRAATDFLKWLGVRPDPTTDQIVGHLLECSRAQAPVNKEVYVRLDQACNRLDSERELEGTEEALSRLKSTKCLRQELPRDGTEQGSTQRWLSPAEVFTNNPELGQYRWKLGQDLRSHGHLLDWLGVKEDPDALDSAAVLREVEAAFGRGGVPLPDEDLAVVQTCWELLQEGLDVSSSAELDGLFKDLRTRKVVPDATGVLRLPKEVVLDDCPVRHDWIPEESRHILVERRNSTFRALEKVRVRPLSSALTATILRLNDAEVAYDIGDVLASRRNQLVRAFHEDVKDAAMKIEGFVRKVEASRVEPFRARFAIQGVLEEFEVGTVEALLRGVEAGRPELVVSGQIGRTPWAAVARELVTQLFSGLKPQHHVGNVRGVLEAETARDADLFLDRNAVPPINLSDGQRVSSQETEGPKGGDQPGTELLVEVEASDQSASDGLDDPLLGSGPRSRPDGDIGNTNGGLVEGAELAADDSETKTNGDNATEVISAIGEGGRASTDESVEERTRSESDSQVAASRSAGGRLRSYVLQADSQGENRGVAERQRIGRAAVDAVMACLRREGRPAEKMPEDNPGFDIKSCDPGGAIVYIEVKGRKETWSLDGVEVTRNEFWTAKDEGNQYSLFVVEYVGTERETIYEIRNPARRVDRFVFDSGWKDAADQIYGPG